MARDDDSWLADDEGNLRPEVARQIREHRFVTVAAPEGESEDSKVWDWFARVLATCGIGLAVVVVILGIVHELNPPVGRIVAHGVVLRPGPDESLPKVSDLPVGTAVKIKEATEGWYQVVASRDQSGWVFAGYVVREEGPWRGPGILLARYSFDSVHLDSGSLVLVVKTDKERATVLAADGTRCVIASEDVVALGVLK